MLPIHILLLQQRSASQLLINISAFSLLVIPLHPEEQQNTQTQASRRNSQVKPIANVVVGCIEGQERPSSDQAADIAKHDVGTDGGAARGIRDDVCADLGVAEGAEGEGARGDDEGGSVAYCGLFRGQEHDVADDDQRS